MRFGGTLALVSFIYVLASGVAAEAPFAPVAGKALVALVVFFLFGAGIGALGERIVTEDIDREIRGVDADLDRIRRENEELAGLKKREERGVAVMTSEVRPGQVLADDAKNPAGEALFPKGTALTEQDIAHLISDGVRRVRILTS
ncbi:MAG: hypothetical protein HY720_10945 [Planctomycetes bacterium]|nr:hypothetical protein [Planctomycetota bacterium]